MLEAAAEALFIISDLNRLMFVALGTLLGLMIGVIPGIGGLVGLALLLPFTFALDPYTALAFLVGVQSVTTTSDTIPAVLFGVPGTTGSAATVLDGHPMAKNGEAGRAYGAAFTASVCGGLWCLHARNINSSNSPFYHGGRNPRTVGYLLAGPHPYCFPEPPGLI